MDLRQFKNRSSGLELFVNLIVVANLPVDSFLLWWESSSSSEIHCRNENLEFSPDNTNIFQWIRCLILLTLLQRCDTIHSLSLLICYEQFSCILIWYNCVANRRFWSISEFPSDFKHFFHLHLLQRNHFASQKFTINQHRLYEIVYLFSHIGLSCSA